MVIGATQKRKSFQRRYARRTKNSPAVAIGSVKGVTHG